MVDTFQIIIPEGYQFPKQADVSAGKNYVRRRESAVRGLSSLIDDLLMDAAEQITRLCYIYNVDPRTFTISSSYNEKLFEEIAKILDQLEDDILDLVLDYSLRCTESEKRRNYLLPWLLLLGKGNRNLRQTLERRIFMFSRDLEAMIVAQKLVKNDIQKAITRIKSNIHAAYVMPEMKAAYANASLFKARYIRSKGVKKGNVGSSNSEANNILRFGRITVQMAWMRNQWKNYKEKGVDGYIVARGSNYPCDLCDSKCGFHPIEDTENFPPFHGSCCCWTMPLYKTKE